MKKRGQVTVFIVVGIIILIAVALLFFFRSSIFEEQLDIVLEQDEVAGDAVVVQQYVSSCLQDVSVTALELLGQQGGYINLSRTDMHNRQFDIDLDPTEGDVLFFSGHEIPYWWYEDSGHNCVQCSVTTKNMPTLEQMEDQVSVYVEENLRSCVDSFSGVSAQGFSVSELGGIAVSSEALGDTVYVQLQYPITLESEGSSSQLENWYVEIPVPLEEIYNAAAEVMYMEIADQYLEQITLNIISAYSGLDDERLPPFAGFSEGYVTVFWIHELVKEQLQQYLTTYIPLIQIQGTSAAVEISPATEYGTGFFTMLWRESTYPFGDIAVNFIFDDFDYYLHITPRSGEILKPASYTQEFGIPFIPPIQTNHYNFYYDLSYPVVVSLRSEDALYGEGYTFLYGMEANLRDNRNLIQWVQGKGSFGEWDPSQVEVGLKEGAPEEIPTGVDENEQTIYTTVEEPDPTLICDYDQRVSGTISVSAYDGITGDALPEASVSFRCGTYQTCTMGHTDTNGDYTSAFPICIGGLVQIFADGYYPNYVQLDTLPEQENSIIALLEPIKEVPITIKYIPVSRLNESMSMQSLKALAFDMDMYDSVLLTLEKVPESSYEQGYGQVATITKDEDATLLLVSGTYEVNAILMNDLGVIIPARNETISGELIEYPEVNITMLGGSNLDVDSGYWEVDSEDLHGAEGVIFYLFRISDPLYVEELGQLGNISDYSVIYRDVIEPSWE